MLKDDDYVAKLARSRFLLSKEGEQIYPTPEQMKTQTSGAEESKSSSEKIVNHSLQLKQLSLQLNKLQL